MAKTLLNIGKLVGVVQATAWHFVDFQHIIGGSSYVIDQITFD